MPNWCENTLTVTGPKKDRARFRDRVKGEKGPLCFHTTFPTPEELLEKWAFFGPYKKEDSPGLPSWYNWRLQHWGSKWDVDSENVDFDYDKERLIYRFDSAWSPPSQWVTKVSGLFPSLEFELIFSEGGNAFWGRETFKAGKIIETESLEEEEYLDRYDEEYRSEKEHIQSLNPEDLKKKLLENDLPVNYSQIEELALNSLTLEDLPLFLNHNWEYIDGSEIIERRLKEAK